MDEYADLLRVSVAAVRHRRRHMRRRGRRDREHVRRPCGRRGVPRSSRGHGPERQRRRLRPVEPVGHRRSVRARDERAADPEADLGPLPRRARLRPVPDLRRLAAEPDDPRDRLSAREGVADAALLDPDRAEPVRRLHAKLGARRPLPRQGPLHGHDHGARHVRPDECTDAEDVHPEVVGRSASSACAWTSTRSSPLSSTATSGSSPGRRTANAAAA